VLLSALSAAENTTTGSSCATSLPIWANPQNNCRKTPPLQYSKSAALTPLFGGETRLNYDMKQNTTADTVSMGAQYSNDQFVAKVQGSYVKPKTDNTPSIGKTNLMVQYHQKLWDSLSLNASENVTIPLKTANEQTDPLKYTSMLKALYPVNDIYNVFAEGSYTLLDTPASETALYRNPYSYTTGINYSDGTDTAINASYMIVQGADPTLGANKKIKVAHKHKINKKLKTSLSVTKSLETDQPDNKASLDVIYAF
jgi:hypothetical protein